MFRMAVVNGHGVRAVPTVAGTDPAHAMRRSDVVRWRQSRLDRWLARSAWLPTEECDELLGRPGVRRCREFWAESAGADLR